MPFSTLPPEHAKAHRISALAFLALLATAILFAGRLGYLLAGCE